MEARRYAKRRLRVGKKQIKIGVRHGDGPAPGYRWNVAILDIAFNEVMGFLREPEYQHIAMPIQELAREDDPSHSRTASVDQVQDFFELREKGGILGKKNVRIFFGLDKSKQAIVILGGLKKESTGQIPDGTRISINRRWRKYRNGDYGEWNP
jgi:hypothetical protein